MSKWDNAPQAHSGVSNINFDIWIWDAYANPMKNCHLGFQSKVLPGPLPDLREYDTVPRADNYFAEYRMLFSRRRGNERDIFEIALDGTSHFRGSCIDVIKKPIA